jgi:predicted ATP-grasp superfamily ATP-dependent carboligase
MSDDPSGTKRERWLADELAKAQSQLRDRETQTRVEDEAIERWVMTYRNDTGDKWDEIIIPAAAKHFQRSKKTIWNALARVRERREAEAAHSKAYENQLTATKPDSLQS